MNYIEKMRSLVNTFKDKDYFLVTKISSLKKHKAEFTVRANQNFVSDMKYVLPTTPYSFRHGGADFRNFDAMYAYVSKMDTFDINQFVKNPDSNRHKICINLPESEEHLRHLYALSDETDYKFLNPQFLARNPIRGGYHARTSLTIGFGNTYVIQTMIRFLRNEAKQETLDRIKDDFRKRLDEIDTILAYIGGYRSYTHKVVNHKQIEDYRNALKNVIDNCTVDAIVENDAKYIHGMFGQISFKSNLVINLCYKDESDLLHFLFLKDNPSIFFSQTVIFRPLKEHHDL
jgi:hypothetical protein